MENKETSINIQKYRKYRTTTSRSVGGAFCGSKATVAASRSVAGASCVAPVAVK